MIKCNRDLVELKGQGIQLAAEYAAITHTLVMKYPNILEVATKMIEDISKEIEDDKTDFDNN